MINSMIRKIINLAPSFFAFILSCIYLLPSIKVGYSLYDGKIVRVGEIYPFSVSTQDNFLHISFFFESDNLCYFILYPRSHILFEDSRKYAESPVFVKVGKFEGRADVRVNNCNFVFGDFSISSGEVRLFKNKVDIIEGVGNYRGKKVERGKGIVSGRIYELLPPPSILLPRDGDELSRFYFSFVPVDGAKKYYIELAPDRNFKFPFLFQELESARFFPQEITITAISDEYFFRLWYENSEGFSSMYSEVRKFRLPK